MEGLFNNVYFLRFFLHCFEITKKEQCKGDGHFLVKRQKKTLITQDRIYWDSILVFYRISTHRIKLTKGSTMYEVKFYKVWKNLVVIYYYDSLNISFRSLWIRLSFHPMNTCITCYHLSLSSTVQCLMFVNFII